MTKRTYGITRDVMHVLKEGTLPGKFTLEDIKLHLNPEYAEKSIRRTLNQLAISGTLAKSGNRSMPYYAINRPTTPSEALANLRQAIKKADTALENAERLLKAVEESTNAKC